MKKVLTAALITGIIIVVSSLGIYAAEGETEAFDPLLYIETLCSGDAVSLQELYPHTESYLTALEYIGGMDKLQESLGKNGKLISMEEAETVQIGGIMNYHVLCTFEEQQMILVINIDGEKKVAGVETLPYQENTTSSETEQSDQKTEDAASQSDMILDIFRDMALKALQIIVTP